MMTEYFLELGAASRLINKDDIGGAYALNLDGIYMWQYYQRFEKCSQTEVSGIWKLFVNGLS